jgi:hypothetical protein
MAASGGRCWVRLHGFAKCDVVFVNLRRRKCPAILCQNCVTCPCKPPVNTIVYGDTLTLIEVAEVVDSELRWWDLVCVSTRGRSRFPSVLDRPLRHLSAFRINELRATEGHYRTRAPTFVALPPSRFLSAAYTARVRASPGNCVRPANVARSLTAISLSCCRGWRARRRPGTPPRMKRSKDTGAQSPLCEISVWCFPRSLDVYVRSRARACSACYIQYEMSIR